tara:strand:+ start:442 stop:1125 length:684 start_codon:yes stop_codon:yes gene_type:complete
MFIRFLLIINVIFISLLISGCKSELVEIEINTSDIFDVINGESTDVEFESVFSLISELDDETKMQLEKMEVVAEKYVSIDDFDVTEGEYLGLNISVEGELPIIYNPNGSIDNSITSPWVLLISDNDFSGSLSDYKYKLEFVITPSYAAFDGELQNINFMLTADKFQPVKFKIKNKHDGKFEIFTGAVETDGESLTLLETVVEKRISLTMKEGIYNKTNQVIYFNIIN